MGTQPRILVGAPPARDADILILGMAHAGAGSAPLLPLGSALGDGVCLQAVRLPGRETRIGELPHTDIESVATEIADAITSIRFAGAIILFGHCLGALAMYEVASQLQQARPQIQALVVSSQASPDLLERGADHSALDSNAFWRMVGSLGGLPTELSANEEMRELLEPTLRADWEVTETFRGSERPPLSVPIHAVWGRHDTIVNREQVAGWANETSNRFTLHEVEGDHFLLSGPASGEVVRVLNAIAAHTSRCAAG